MHQLSFEYFQNDLLDFLLHAGLRLHRRFPYHRLLRHLMFGLQLNNELAIHDVVLINVLVMKNMVQFLLCVLLG